MFGLLLTSSHHLLQLDWIFLDHHLLLKTKQNPNIIPQRFIKKRLRTRCLKKNMHDQRICIITLREVQARCASLWLECLAQLYLVIQLSIVGVQTELTYSVRMNLCSIGLC